MKKTHSLNELDQLKMLSESMVRIEEEREMSYSDEEWYDEAKQRGFEVSPWGFGSANAIDDEGNVVGTWKAEADTSDGRATGWFN
ncbi:MAG: hypothetical protein DRQ89_15385 [Epsilonproteobacteria bacterium]|nr:MAG: hypothetical protein DRQ89_15385 [Campylobacterota bacterium]